VYSWLSLGRVQRDGLLRPVPKVQDFRADASELQGCAPSTPAYDSGHTVGMEKVKRTTRNGTKKTGPRPVPKEADAIAGLEPHGVILGKETPRAGNEIRIPDYVMRDFGL
jgi:hypothetical protein